MQQMNAPIAVRIEVIGRLRVTYDDHGEAIDEWKGCYCILTDSKKTESFEAIGDEC